MRGSINWRSAGRAFGSFWLIPDFMGAWVQSLWNHFLKRNRDDRARFPGSYFVANRCWGYYFYLILETWAEKETKGWISWWWKKRIKVTDTVLCDQYRNTGTRFELAKKVDTETMQVPVLKMQVPGRSRRQSGRSRPDPRGRARSGRTGHSKPEKERGRVFWRNGSWRERNVVNHGFFWEFTR